MERVNGIGGFFFRSTDAEALSGWYAEHLGVGGTDEDPEWHQDAGPTVVDPEPYDYGRFAQLQDPEGNAVQLWQPA